MFGPEEEKEYMLIGMILGLAIYNNITLDVNFPPVLFKKILGYPGTFDDMEEAHPTIYRSMVTLLQYDGELPVEDCFCLTYQGIIFLFTIELRPEIEKKIDKLNLSFIKNCFWTSHYAQSVAQW